MSHTSRASLVVVCLLIAACGSAAPHSSSAKMAAEPAAAPATPPPLDRSLFARDTHGSLTEDALQKILAAPIELDLPSRVGVLPVTTARDWRGPNPDERVPAGVAQFIGTLRTDPAFSQITETMVIPSGALGMEALREVAARYRLRYLLLYREVLEKKTKHTGWAAGYATVVGALFLPGQRHEVWGYIEASMFDVKTGLLMFTTRRSINASQRSNIWYGDDKLAQLASTTTSKFAPSLATDVLEDLRRFAAVAAAENEQRGARAVVNVPGVNSPTVATDANK